MESRSRGPSGPRVDDDRISDLGEDERPCIEACRERLLEHATDFVAVHAQRDTAVMIVVCVLVVVRWLHRFDHDAPPGDLLVESPSSLSTCRDSNALPSVSAFVAIG